jgi:hypothetical protein
MSVGIISLLEYDVCISGGERGKVRDAFPFKKKNVHNIAFAGGRALSALHTQYQVSVHKCADILPHPPAWGNGRKIRPLTLRAGRPILTDPLLTPTWW